MKLRLLLSTLATGLFSLSAAHATCQNNGAHTITAPTHTLSYSPAPTSPAVGQNFSLQVDVCNSDGSPFAGNLEVNAHMPAHRHGMNYAPQVNRLGNGHYQIDGFLLHMPGHWQFTFDLLQGQKNERLLSDYTIK